MLYHFLMSVHAVNKLALRSYDSLMYIYLGLGSKCRYGKIKCHD